MIGGRMRRIVVVAVMAWLWASTVVITPPRTAEAQATMDCPAGSVCLWPEEKFGGNRIEIKDFKNGDCIDVEPDFKSLKNKTTDKVVQAYRGNDVCDPFLNIGNEKTNPGEERETLEGGSIEVE